MPPIRVDPMGRCGVGLDARNTTIEMIAKSSLTVSQNEGEAVILEIVGLSIDIS